MPPTLPRLRSDAPSDDIVAGLRDAGAVIVEGLLSPDVVTRRRCRGSGGVSEGG